MNRSIRSAALSLLLAFGITTGMMTVGAGPAQAATGVSFCFKWANGTAYSSQPVYLMSWNGNAWVTERSTAGKTNSSGCGTFNNTPAHKYLLVRAHVTFKVGYRTDIYTGDTPYWANPGQGTVNVGTGTVRYYGSL